MANTKSQKQDNAKSLKLKLSLKKETLRELNDSQVGALDQVVGGTIVWLSNNCCDYTHEQAN
ncbi:hypothetical protein D7V80_06800 [Corallococcus sp. CA054B]|uniref:hypothetical protein n=1 Tax=Corallococcus sp. CA054B TaxID=2316734 RepID=UPI000EA13116|nr:hypothetical protein [Corallococcus sp. CA054B]RKG70012.1 hypothetical protein D7V80_06800 [Corallococcus sp. CA054B]